MQGFNLHHVGIVTGNIDDSMKFYKEFMGFDIIEEKNVPGMKIVYLKGNNLTIELLCPEHNVQKTGLRHIAFKVNDIEKIFKESKIAGLTVYPDKPQEHENLKFFFIRGPEGEEIEFMEVKDE